MLLFIDRQEKLRELNILLTSTVRQLHRMRVQRGLKKNLVAGQLGHGLERIDH